MKRLKSTLPHLHLLLTISLVVFFIGGGVLGRLSAPSPVAHNESGGYVASKLKAPTISFSGGSLATSWSLDKFVTRVHDQGNTNTCVAQTGSTVEEIIWNERGIRTSFSVGYIYDQIKIGGIDAGANYPDMANLLVAQGDVTLNMYPPDVSYGYPTSYTQTLALPYRLASWYSIANTDQYSIEFAISHGIPLQIAFTIYSSFFENFGIGYVPSFDGEWGYVKFDHSMTGIAYDPTGVTILNSWGNNWGGNGRAHLSWNFLTQMNVSIIAIVPRHLVPKSPIMKSGNVKIWNQYRKEHKDKKGHSLSLIPYAKHGKKIYAASLWVKHNPARMGGITSDERFFPQPKGRGYMENFFQGYTLTWWVHHPKWHPTWTHHKWLR
jgi:hypothetical protein